LFFNWILIKIAVIIAEFNTKKNRQLITAISSTTKKNTRVYGYCILLFKDHNCHFSKTNISMNP
jgi:RNA-binding protein YhbY